MAKVLGISQDGVSRLEKRSDLLLSTLRKYLGGLVCSGGEKGYKILSTHICSVNAPTASVARAIRSKIPATLGTPLIRPVDERVSPAGSKPSDREKITGGVPKRVINCCE